LKPVTIKKVFDLILPRLCEHCGAVLSSTEEILCTTCFSRLTVAGEERLALEYKRKFAPENHIDDFLSAFLFDQNTPVQSVIHSLKYNGKFKIGIFLGKTAAQILSTKLQNWEADFIIPVPLFHSKKAERGYNQSFYIAKGLSLILNIPVKANLTKRIRYTETQTALSLEERKENMLNAFDLKKRKSIEGSKIILVDDVITTGSTVRECGKTLKRNGAVKVFAFSVAIAN